MKVRRIVVGLDTAPQSRRALAAAMALAGELGAELEALFVESEELHRLAALPFARELGYSTASARPMDQAALARALATQVRAARRELTELAGAQAVRWSFRVARGSVADELLAASSESDITVVGLSRWGPEAMRLAQPAPATRVFLAPGTASRGPLAAVCPIAVPAERAVSLLCALERALGDGLTLLAVGEDLPAAGRWCEEAAAMLEKHGRKASLEIVREGQAEALRIALERLAPRVVAILAPAPPADR